MTYPERLVIIGHPVSQSLSPIMQNAALGAAGIQLEYEALDVSAEELTPTLRRLSRMNCAGNITLPHKKSAIGSMASISPAAAAARAVNTFWCHAPGRLAGDNTDVEGFASLAVTLMNGSPRGSMISVIGCGGGAAAVLVAAAEWSDCEVTVHARNQVGAKSFCRTFSACTRVTTIADPVIGEADIVVNATPIGLDDNAQPVDVARLSSDATVIDLCYGPQETPWVRAARARGLRASDGLPMLVSQGAAAFRRWFGREPDERVMWEAVLRATGRLRTA